jgi:hypothetical protein
VPFCILEPKGPDLGDDEGDERCRAHGLAQPEPRGVSRHRGGQQPLCFLDHDRDVHAPPGQEDPQHREQDPNAFPAVRGHRRQRAGGQGQLPSGFLRRSPDHLAGRPRHLR